MIQQKPSKKSETPKATVNDGPRQVRELDKGWRFHFGELKGAEKPGYDDSAWKKVTVPHNWDAQEADQGLNGKRGKGWYRLNLNINPVKGRRYFLYFDGASLVSTVWLNGKFLGAHWSGFSAFCFDITDTLKPGSNTLVVLADSSWRDDIPPREGDFTIFGGLYRKVRLISTTSIFVDLLDRASPGVRLTTPNITQELGVVRASVKIQNSHKKQQDLVLFLRIQDADGKSAVESRMEYTAPPGASETLLEAHVPHPHLWNGRKDPYLYQAVVDIFTESDFTDRVRQPLGFRTIQFDPEKGFLLNGQPYDLYGVNLHQDREGKGWAVSSQDREQDLRMIDELGATFVRFVHYQHDRQAYDLCDRLGLVAWAENALVNTVSASPPFSEFAVSQMSDLIRQNFNHPSIVVWGAGNEVQTNKPQAPELLIRLNSVVKAEDYTRPSVIATCFDEVPGTYSMDLVAHNKYFGWYTGAFTDFPKWLNAQHKKMPGGCQGMAEYGAGAGINTHRSEPKALDHSEQWQALFHEAYWRSLRDKPWVWCKAVWQMFDAASVGRNEGEHKGINDKGLVTRDRQVKKDAFYWYKANWNPEPMVYITSKRFTPRTESRTPVKVYSNSKKVELILNGKSLGKKTVKDHVALWKKVELSAGENKLEAIAIQNGVTVTDACTWVLNPKP